MDLTLPEIPGAIIGYRRNGTPIRLIAGASPDDPSNTPADTDPAAEPETGDDEEEIDWKARAEQLEADRDKWKKLSRQNERAARSAQKPRPQGDPDPGDDEGPSAAELRAAEAEAEMTLMSVAIDIGQDAVKLLDSLKFRKQLDKLDVADLDELAEEAEKLIREHLKKQPAAPKTGTPPRKQGADMSGGANGRERPKGLAAAIAARMAGAK